MTIHQAKQSGLKKLNAAHDAEAAIDAEILLAHALGISREELLAHDERTVPGFALARYRRYLARRAKHEPIAYIVGHREFFGLQFEVNKHTLIPRPETELLVEEILKIITMQKPGTPPTPSFSKRGINTTPPLEQGRVGRVLLIDVGTGSGAIAVSVAANSNAAVIATDISKPALETAERNATKNGVADRIDFRRADLLAKRGQTPLFFLFPKIKGSVPFSPNVIIAANLPYIPTKDWRKCMPDVKNFEPRTALDGGPDGLRLYDKLFHQIASIWQWTPRSESGRLLNFSQADGGERGGRSTALICEIDPSQKKSFPALAKKHFPAARVEIKNDLANLPRVAIVKLVPKY